MPSFSAGSKAQLESCDPRLQRVFNKVIETWDCVILEGHRGQAAQEEAFRKGLSKLHYPHGNHNSIPSKAADVAPYPVDWGNTRRFDHFAGFVLGIATSMGIKLRWGGDWNRNHNPKDETFVDLPHFEIDE